MEDREKVLLSLFKDLDDKKEIIEPLISDVVFIEHRLKELRELPFIRVSKRDIAIQESTPASKQYKELLQQYNNCIKILDGMLSKNGEEDDSPLREYLKSRKIE